MPDRFRKSGATQWISSWTSRLRPDVRSAFLNSKAHFDENGLPNFDFVIETSAFSKTRIGRIGAESKLRIGYHDDEDDEDDFQDEVDFENKVQQLDVVVDDSSHDDRCVYCSAPACQLEPIVLCADCVESIEVNRRDLETEHADGKKANQIAFYGFLIILGVVVIGTLVIVLTSLK